MWAISISMGGHRVLRCFRLYGLLGALGYQVVDLGNVDELGLSSAVRVQP